MNSVLHSMPAEMWRHIFSFIPNDELSDERVSLALVNKNLHAIAVAELDRERVELIKSIESIVKVLAESRDPTYPTFENEIDQYRNVVIKLKNDHVRSFTKIHNMRWDVYDDITYQMRSKFGYVPHLQKKLEAHSQLIQKVFENWKRASFKKTDLARFQILDIHERQFSLPERAFRVVLGILSTLVIVRAFSLKRFDSHSQKYLA